MRTLHTRKGGFTLIELMIVVAIIGILAAIAIPNFLQFQLRSKTGEAKTNLAAIRTAEEGYFAEFNNYVQAGSTPGTTATANKRVWSGSGITMFDQLGWSPEGEVFYNYAVVGVTAASSYTIGATGDLDTNGTPSDYGYVHPAPGATAGLASTLSACVGTGVWNPSTAAADLLNTVGPCAALDGQSEF